MLLFQMKYENTSINKMAQKSEIRKKCDLCSFRNDWFNFSVYQTMKKYNCYATLHNS